MKRPFPPLFLAVPLLLAACGEPEVTVVAELPQAGSTTREPVSDLPVRLVPYDRDAIIDSLTAKAGIPEPKLPPALQLQRDSLASVQAEWRAENARLLAIQDTIPTLTVRVGSDPAERERKVRQAQRLDQEQREVKQRIEALQARISARSRAIRAIVDSVRTERERWSAKVLKDFDAIAQARMSGGRTGAVDTTGRAGSAVLHVEEGRWWVTARYTLPDVELYWNFPVEVTSDQTQVILNEKNAERRPLF
jgi:hypothetical protein